MFKFKFEDKELRAELERSGLVVKDKYWDGEQLLGSRVVRDYQDLYKILNALTKHLNLVLKHDDRPSEYYFVKRKKKNPTGHPLPVHDWASHGADAFMGLARAFYVTRRNPERDAAAPPPESPPPPTGVPAPLTA